MAGRDVKIMPLCDANVIVAEEFSLFLCASSLLLFYFIRFVNGRKKFKKCKLG